MLLVGGRQASPPTLTLVMRGWVLVISLLKRQIPRPPTLQAGRLRPQFPPPFRVLGFCFVQLKCNPLPAERLSPPAPPAGYLRPPSAQGDSVAASAAELPRREAPVVKGYLLPVVEVPCYDRSLWRRHSRPTDRRQHDGQTLVCWRVGPIDLTLAPCARRAAKARNRASVIMVAPTAAFLP